ncbi:GNAT family N-acetyltransferase [Streptomyces chumphonensis]|uniref:GNAT family N-acetyltransferase n=1 Tax=Streptomyces chumphonensis TaxID=1214925 RepID=UPI003D721C92
MQLRQWRTDDADALVAAFAEPEMDRQTATPVDTPAAARSWIGRRAEEWGAGTSYAFAVVDAADAVLGNVAVSAVERVHGTGWVSYWTVTAARGRGVATFACRTVSRWAFDDLGLFRLELGHRVDNPASCAVALASGYAVEGLQRQRLAYDGIRHDVEVHARLATDADPGLGTSSR